MKKLVIFFTLMLGIFLYIPNLNVNATTYIGDDNIEFTYQSGELIITLNNVNSAFDVNRIIFQSPLFEQYPYNIYECELGGITWGLELYDHEGLEFNTMYYSQDLFDYAQMGVLTECRDSYVFVINLIDFGPNVSNFLVNKVVITIPLKMEAPALSETDLYNYYNSFTLEYIKFNQSSYNLFWAFENISNGYYYFKSSLLLGEGLQPNYLYIPESKFNTGSYNSVNSRIDYYNTNNSKLCSVNLSLKIPLEGLIEINPYDLIECKAYSGSIARIDIYIIQSPYDNFTFGDFTSYESYFKGNATYTYNELLYVLNLFNGSTRLRQIPFTVNEITGVLIPEFTINELPRSYREDLIFNEWAYSNGTVYNTTLEFVFNQMDYYNFTGIDVPNPEYLVNNELNLYATFKLKESNIPIIIKNPDQKLDTVLGAFGLNSDVGYLLIYCFIVIITDIALYLFIKSNLLILIVSFIITSIFTFMGVLNLLTMILIYSLLVVLFIIELRRED